MAIVTETFPFINANGERVDIPLTDDKNIALATDTLKTSCLAVYMGGRKLYAPTSNSKTVPDIAPLAFFDADKNIRYVHTHFGEKTPVLYATYTGSFNFADIQSPYGGYVEIRSGNGSSGGGGSNSGGGSGGRSGYGWKINVNGIDYNVVSGGGGGGGGHGTNPSGSRPAGATNIVSPTNGSGGSGGSGSFLKVEWEDEQFSISATVGRNGGGGGGPNNGGTGGNAWPLNASGKNLHRGNSGGTGRAGSWRYMNRTVSGSSGSGGRGGYGYGSGSGEESSQGGYSVKIYTYQYVATV
jgi:hypothetical protein